MTQSAQQAFESMSIEMRLHRERIPAGQESFFFHRVGEDSELARIFWSYRATSRGVMRSKANPWARPMRVAEVAARLSEYAPGNRAIFQRYIDQYSAQKGTRTLRLPAFDLAEDGFLLLDGIHRTTALAIVKCPFALELAVIRAPIDRRVMIDLKYWDGGFARFPARWNRRRAAGTTPDYARRA